MQANAIQEVWVLQMARVPGLAGNALVPPLFHVSRVNVDGYVGPTHGRLFRSQRNLATRENCDNGADCSAVYSTGESMSMTT